MVEKRRIEEHMTVADPSGRHVRAADRIDDNRFCLNARAAQPAVRVCGPP